MKSQGVPGRLLTVAQLAELWAVSSRTVRRMISRHEIEIVRIGRAIRIRADVAILAPKHAKE